MEAIGQEMRHVEIHSVWQMPNKRMMVVVNCGLAVVLPAPAKTLPPEARKAGSQQLELLTASGRSVGWTTIARLWKWAGQPRAIDAMEFCDWRPGFVDRVPVNTAMMPGAF